MVMELLLRACLCKLDKVITCLIYATKKCKYAPLIWTKCMAAASDSTSEYCDTLSFQDRVVKGFCRFVLHFKITTRE